MHATSHSRIPWGSGLFSRSLVKNETSRNYFVGKRAPFWGTFPGKGLNVLSSGKLSSSSLRSESKPCIINSSASMSHNLLLIQKKKHPLDLRGKSFSKWSRACTYRFSVSAMLGFEPRGKIKFDQCTLYFYLYEDKITPACTAV